MSTDLFSLDELEVGIKKYSLETNDSSLWIKIDSEHKILDLAHDKLDPQKLALLKDYFIFKHADKLISLSVGLLYQIVQKKIIDLDINNGPELDEYEDFIDQVELQEHPVFMLPIEELRQLAMFIKYPDTKSNILCSPFEGHLICRCFGVSREVIEQFISENPDLSLKEINSSLSVGTGCGSCMTDLKNCIELFEQKQNPSPIEWMISFDSLAKAKGYVDWGVFQGISGENIISVELKSMAKESFERFAKETGQQSLNFQYVAKKN